MSADHPSLFIRSRAGVQRLRDRAKVPPFAPFARAVTCEADRLLSADPVALPAEPDPITPETPRTNEIACARDVQERVVVLSLAWLLTGVKDFADRAVREMRHAIERWDRWVDWAHRPLECDLMTATVAAGIGIGFDWLGEAIGVDDRVAILLGMKRRAFEPFLLEIERKAAWAIERGFRVGMSKVNNWNGWINGGVGLAAAAMLDEAEEARRALAAARENIRLYVQHIQPDGGSEEGSGYWAVGMRYAVMFFEALRTRLGTDDGFFAGTGVDRTGYFPIWLTPGGEPMTFGDAAGSGADPAAFYILADRLENSDLAWYPATYGEAGAAHAVWELLRRPERIDPNPADWPRAHHWASIDWAFLSSGWPIPDVYLSFKSGDLGVSHSQLDLNTFQLYAFGEKLAIDLGAPHYSLGYFRRQRWQMYPVTTAGHNGVLIDGQGQAPYAKGHIEDFRAEQGFASLTGVADDAYGENVRRVRRHVAFVRNRYFVLLDEVSADRPVSLTYRLHTFGQARVADDSAYLSGQKAGLAVLWANEPVVAAVLGNPGGWTPAEQVLELTGREKKQNWLLVTLLYPCRGTDRPSASLEVDRHGGGLRIHVADSEGEDVVSFSHDGGHWRFDAPRAR